MRPGTWISENRIAFIRLDIHDSPNANRFIMLFRLSANIMIHHQAPFYFLAGRTFGSLTDCNQQAALWTDTANARLHGTTKNKPIDLFREKEQSLLIPLPKTDYDTRIVCPVKSTAQALVFFDANRYSVPFTHAAMILALKADEQFISIYDKEEASPAVAVSRRRTSASATSISTRPTAMRRAAQPPVVFCAQIFPISPMWHPYARSVKF